MRASFRLGAQIVKLFEQSGEARSRQVGFFDAIAVDGRIFKPTLELALELAPFGCVQACAINELFKWILAGEVDDEIVPSHFGYFFDHFDDRQDDLDLGIDS
jgi:hypothetical protein